MHYMPIKLESGFSTSLYHGGHQSWVTVHCSTVHELQYRSLRCPVSNEKRLRKHLSYSGLGHKYCDSPTCKARNINRSCQRDQRYRLSFRVGSFTWKAEWGRQYHQSMVTGIAAVASAIFLAFVMRSLLKNENRKLDEDELGGLKGADQKRIEDAARLEGITTEEAMEKKKGFRYLY